MPLSLLSFLLGALAWLPWQLLRGLRRLRLGGSRAVVVKLGQARSSGPGSLARELAVVESMRWMADDPKVKAVVLDLRDLAGGHATLQALRHAILHLRDSGTLVVTHLDTLTTRDLLLASAADHVWLTPSGEAFLQGIGAHLQFYGDALAKLGVVVEMQSAGAYKSFGERFTRSHASPENRAQTTTLVEDLHSQMVRTIGEARDLDPDAVESLLARSPLAAEDALDAGLVDALAYPDQAKARLKDLLDVPVRRIPYGRYARWTRWTRALGRVGAPPQRVAVVHLEGPIVQGAEPSGGAGHRIDSDRVVPALDALRKDDLVKAVVLYVNSPGGSALASDLIARAVRRLVEDKPVVALFGDVSASGGYYLSAPAAEIIAAPGTITGSIGVVGGKLALGPALERHGVHHERIGAGPETGLLHPWAPLTDDQRQRFRRMLIRTYDRFLQVVSAGRKQPVEAIRAVAEGKVWTGRQALDHGLVDRLGGLDLALKRARTLSSLDDGQDAVDHIHFSPPRYHVLRALLVGAQARSGGDLLRQALAALGPSGHLARMVHDHPMQPLMVLPWQIDLE